MSCTFLFKIVVAHECLSLNVSIITVFIEVFTVAIFEVKNNEMFLLWEIRSVVMEIVLIVVSLQHGCRENPLYVIRLGHRSNYYKQHL